MATIGKITRADNGTAAISYAIGKNKLDQNTKDWLRENGVSAATIDTLNDRAVVMDGLNVYPKFAAAQMKATRAAFKTGGKQVTRVIQSFPTADLDAANPKDWLRANELGIELATKAFPDYQVGVYTQLDGEGHKLHNHIIVNMPNLQTGKKYNQHREWEVISKFNDEIAVEHGLSVIKSHAAKELKDYEHAIQPKPAERHTMAERQRSKRNEYVWKDDLRSRIDAAMLNHNDKENLAVRLKNQGVAYKFRGSNITWSFTDQNGKERKARGTTLGNDYEREVIVSELDRQNTTDFREQQLNREISDLAAKQRTIDREQQHINSTRHPEGNNDSQITTTTQRPTASQPATDTGQIRITVAYRQRIERIGDHQAATDSRFERPISGHSTEKSTAEPRESATTNTYRQRIADFDKKTGQMAADFNQLFAKIKRLTRIREELQRFKAGLQRFREQVRSIIAKTKDSFASIADTFTKKFSADMEKKKQAQDQAKLEQQQQKARERARRRADYERFNGRGLDR